MRLTGSIGRLGRGFVRREEKSEGGKANQRSDPRDIPAHQRGRRVCEKHYFCRSVERKRERESEDQEASAAKMCTETTYTLPCQHVRTITSYCSSAPAPSRSKSSRSGRSAGAQRQTCANTMARTIPHPPPPHISAVSVPKCPLATCPYEARNRRWNCCWCGKSWNEGGRCSCVMIIDGSEVRCEHICCATCEAAE